MFLSKDTKSPFYQIIYFVDGKRTKISTKTTNKREAERFLKSFVPKPNIKKNKTQEQRDKKVSVKLSSFIEEYKT